MQYENLEDTMMTVSASAASSPAKKSFKRAQSASTNKMKTRVAARSGTITIDHQGAMASSFTKGGAGRGGGAAQPALPPCL